MKYKTLCDPNTCYFCGIKSNPNNKSFRSVVEIHHLQEKCNNGKNNAHNLVAVCSNHHSLIHEGIIKIDKWYFSTKGWLLKWEDELGVTHWGSNHS